MKFRCNKRWTKRKHRNGKRPERKGSIKINLLELPQLDDVLSISWGISEKLGSMLRAVAPVPYLKDMSDLSNPAWVAAFNKSKQDLEAYNMAAKPLERAAVMLGKARNYLRAFTQVKSNAIALGAINDANRSNTLQNSTDCSQDETALIAKALDLHLS